jgi:hypothetical protein
VPRRAIEDRASRRNRRDEGSDFWSQDRDCRPERMGGSIIAMLVAVALKIFLHWVIGRGR